MREVNKGNTREQERVHVAGEERENVIESTCTLERDDTLGMVMCVWCLYVCVYYTCMPYSASTHKSKIIRLFHSVFGVSGLGHGGFTHSISLCHTTHTYTHTNTKMINTENMMM